MFSLSILTRAFLGLGALACTACAGLGAKSDGEPAPQAFYTVTGEIALSRGERRVAALQYSAAAMNDTNPKLLARATEVATDALQPTLASADAARWIDADPKSLDAQRAAGKAALALYRVDEAAAHYKVVLTHSPDGADAEFTLLETEFSQSEENLFAARQLADRLASMFPPSAAAARLQGMTALRADDPAAAVQKLELAVTLSAHPRAAPDAPVRAGSPAQTDSRAEGQADLRAEAQAELQQALLRARILAGDVDAPLAQARAQLVREDTQTNRLDFALLLMTARRDSAAREQLEILRRSPDAAPTAMRFLGLLDFQDGHFEEAGKRFTELLRTGKYLDDSFYYLGLIADRNGDAESALRFYVQVQGGDNALPALLRATRLLQLHGAAPAAGDLVDRILLEEPERAPEILNARARMFADAGDLPRALAVLERARLEYPDSAEVRYTLASIDDDHGQGRAALRELTAVVKARPDDPAALNALGYTLADHDKELTRARKLVERAYAAAPANSAILDSLGWVLFRQGHAEQALPYLTAAYTEDRGADTAAHLGEVLWQLGKRADAEHVWSEAAVIDADNPLLKATRLRLHAASG